MINRGLIIRQPWIELILSGQKMWEMRSKPTRIRGRIGLIEQGSGLIVGEAELTGSLDPFRDAEQMVYTRSLHRVDDLDLLTIWRYPWRLEGARRFEKPIPYDHPKGAVTWVKLDNQIS